MVDVPKSPVIAPPVGDGAGERRGVDKVAAILLALDRGHASKLLKRLRHEEIILVARAAVDLGALAPREVEGIFDEFSSAWTEGADLRGSAEEARRLLSEALPPGDAAEALVDALGDSDASVWVRLNQSTAASVATLIASERPNIGAYILRNLDAEFAAAVVAEHPIKKRAELLGIMISAPDIAEPVKQVVEGSLKNKFLKNPPASAGLEAISKVASIVGSFNSLDAEAIIKDIEAFWPLEGRNLRRMLFAFEDVDKLSKQALSLLFDKISTEIVVLALRGTEAAFRTTVLSCLASRARRLVESELAMSANASQVEIAKARKSIAEQVLRLVSSGEIELPVSESDAEAIAGQIRA